MENVRKVSLVSFPRNLFLSSLEHGFTATGFNAVPSLLCRHSTNTIAYTHLLPGQWVAFSGQGILLLDAILLRKCLRISSQLEP